MSAAAAARPSRLQAWRLAARPATLTAAAAPVAVGTAVAIRDDAFALLPALAALFGAFCLQVGANFANDVFDHERGADTPDRLGPPRASQLGLLSPRELKLGMAAAFGLAMVAGVYLAWVGGWPVLAVGLASIAAAIVYTGGPWPIGYHALGDLFTFVFFGLVAVMGTYYVQAGAVTWGAFAAAVPVGATVTMILVVNNLRDIPTDRRTGKVTLGVVLGERGTRWWFALLLAVALAVPAGATVRGDVPLGAAAALAAGVLAWPLLREVMGETSGRALNPVLRATARFALWHALLWSAAIVASR
ncbi:1,4-dihydroxy-2-naphthoate polyprenyltransferase [Tepidiforma sp.]|uniref:1,4-dihydroxy-2-naphthoate polyprenyltransferase n=1 Tax=Tepidiforma sp. TaxID=2682230 RepID=UPI002ADE58AA|nr:1,4-dihydroxy-2-naphthoate polyprenyltransferase [Tepidiforma sp.]